MEKVRDIVGLYLDPPDKALVLCVDEKAQIQALDRSQPVLPMRPGQVERRTHDYTRHGTTTLFAALNAKSGKVISEFHQRQRATEFRKFLDTVDAAVPAQLDLHLNLDGAALPPGHAAEEQRLAASPLAMATKPASASATGKRVSPASARSPQLDLQRKLLRHLTHPPVPRSPRVTGPPPNVSTGRTAWT